MRTNNNKTKGFSLVEVMVVAAIITLLSGVVLAALNTSRIKARDAKRISEIRQLKSAIELYALDHSTGYPNVGTADNSYPISTLQSSITPYMAALPVDPNVAKDSIDYLFTSSGEVGGLRTSYGIRVRLEESGFCKTGQNVNTAWWGSSVPLCNF